MAKCAYCNATILFGGVYREELRFCNENCREHGVLLTVADQVPGEIVEQAVWEVHQGACPRCRGTGPIDVHTSHRIWSAVIFTSWRSTPHVACRRCGMRAQLADGAFSLLFGWWGIPWGLFMTPVQVVRNVVALSRGPDPLKPSDELAKMIRLSIGSQALEEAQRR